MSKARLWFEEEHPDSLAVYCSDGRFTRAVEVALQRLGHERLDTLTMPGGPAHLYTKTALPHDSASVGHGTDFLIKGHHIKHLVLFAHEGCGYYKERYPKMSGAELIAQQISDLRGADDELTAAHPGMTIVSYLLRHDGATIHVEAVDDAPVIDVPPRQK